MAKQDYLAAAQAICHCRDVVGEAAQSVGFDCLRPGAAAVAAHIRGRNRVAT
jgi:hypothetical protein